MLDTTRTRALSEPAAVAAALWLHEWLGGRAATDDLLDLLAQIAPDTPAGLHDAGGTLPTSRLLRRLRSSGVTLAWPVLPRPGRTVGWPSRVKGDPVPAVVLVGQPKGIDQPPLEARVLLRAGSGGWIVDDIRERRRGAPAGAQGCLATHDSAQTRMWALTADAVTPRAATRQFTELIDQAATDLGRLGLDRPASTGRGSRWTATLHQLPGTADPQLVTLLQRTGLVLDALDQALGDEGAAVTASEARAREAHLHRLRGQLCDLVSGVIIGAGIPATIGLA